MEEEDVWVGSKIGTEEIPRGVEDNIVGHTEVEPTQVLNVKHRVRDTSQQLLLLTSKMAAQGITEGVGRNLNIAIR